MRRSCSVSNCTRPATWGKERFPGFICENHSLIWRDSQARLDVLQLGRRWAGLRGSLETKPKEDSHAG